MSHQNWDLYF